MNCPTCGVKVPDPGLSAYCSACGRKLPVVTRDERHGILYRKISVVTGILAFVFLILGLSLLLPEVIIAYIGGLDGHALYWPIQMYLIVAGVVLLAARHPFAKRSASASIQMIRAIEARWVCSYCGKGNAPGARECDSCGAPLR